MSLNRNEKAAVVTMWPASPHAQTLALAEYRGLTVDHMNKLRTRRAARACTFSVLKNTLARRAVAGTPFEVASETMVGPLIYGFSEDAVAAAKVVADFAKSNDKLVIQGGAYAGKALDANGVKALASIPSQGSAAGAAARPAACRRSRASPRVLARWRRRSEAAAAPPPKPPPKPRRCRLNDRDFVTHY